MIIFIENIHFVKRRNQHQAYKSRKTRGRMSNTLEFQKYFKGTTPKLNKKKTLSTESLEKKYTLKL